MLALEVEAKVRRIEPRHRRQIISDILSTYDETFSPPIQTNAPKKQSSAPKIDLDEIEDVDEEEEVATELPTPSIHPPGSGAKQMELHYRFMNRLLMHHPDDMAIDYVPFGEPDDPIVVHVDQSGSVLDVAQRTIEAEIVALGEDWRGFRRNMSPGPMARISKPQINYSRMRRSDTRGCRSID